MGTGGKEHSIIPNLDKKKARKKDDLGTEYEKPDIIPSVNKKSGVFYCVFLNMTQNAN